MNTASVEAQKPTMLRISVLHRGILPSNDIFTWDDRVAAALHLYCRANLETGFWRVLVALHNLTTKRAAQSYCVNAPRGSRSRVSSFGGARGVPCARSSSQIMYGIIFPAFFLSSEG